MRSSRGSKEKSPASVPAALNPDAAGICFRPSRCVAQAAVNTGRDEMKRYEGIDYDFRPDTYWSAGDPLALEEEDAA